MNLGTKPRRTRASVERRGPGRTGKGLAHFAPIALSAAIGLLVCSAANALSRAMLDPSQLVFWVGLMLISLPIFYRLTSRDASPTERFALVCLLGLALYGVKVVRDVPIFTFPDEPVHAFNADQIVSTGELFQPNPILPATPYFPGLEGATSALMTLTGLSSFGAGVIVVGAARLCLVAAMFLLFQRLSGSARIAGLGAALYTGTFNFLYWGAQFSYESLSLPLLVFLIMVLAEREAAPRERLAAWGIPAILAIAAIVVTHHLTSYAMVIFLIALSVSFWTARRSWHSPNPWPYAVAAAAMALGWLFFFASSTVEYVSPVLGDAIQAIVDTVGGESAPRTLFEKETPVAEETPLAARGVALLAILILAAGLPFGLRRAWRRHRDQPFVIVFALAAVGFFATLALRFAPEAWETGNRAASFLFIGLAFLLAGIGLDRWRPRTMPKLGRILATVSLCVVLAGGAISGWPWDSRLGFPLRIEAEDRTIQSPPLALAEWAKTHLPGEQRFAATIADARMLVVPGGHAAVPGPSPAFDRMLEKRRLDDWEVPLLRKNDIRYVVTDLRRIRDDSIRGLGFSPEGEEMGLPRSSAVKFSQMPGGSRIYTNGPIAVYGLAEEGR